MMKTVKFFAGLLLCISVMVLSSCAEGCDDSERFSSDVQNAQLSSPEINQNCFTTVTSSSGTELVKFTWPLVKGAGGYYCKVSSLENPEEPKVLVDTLIDGLTVLFDKAEDTKYLCEVLTLGNEELNNIGADAPTVFTYSTLVEAIKIEEGNDISEFIGNYITEHKDELDQKYQEDPNNFKLAFELEAGKTYTMNDSVDFLGYPAVLRGDKQNHAIVEMGEKAFFSCWRSMKIQWLTINAANVTKRGVMTLPATPEPSIKSSTGQYIIKSIIFQECEINDVNKYLTYDNQQSYLIEDLEFLGCVVKLNQQAATFYMEKSGYIKFTIANSTIWSTMQSNQLFLNFGGNGPTKVKDLEGVVYPNAYFKLNNSTFYNVSYSKKWAGWSQYGGRSYVTFDIQNVIFDDCSSKQVLVAMGNGNNSYVYSNNTFWYDGEDVTEAENYSKGVPTLKTDPGFANPANGDFTISGADQLKFKTGDPRWIK